MWSARPLFAAALILAPSIACAQTGRSTTNMTIVAGITTANVFQTILAAGNRQSLTIQNNNAGTTENCWIYIGSGTPSKAASILLTPGGSYTRYWPYIPTDPIQATCSNNGDTIYVDIQ